MKSHSFLRLYVLLISCCLLIVASVAISIQLFQNVKRSEADVTQLQVGVNVPSSTTLVGNIFFPGNSKWSADGNLGIGTTSPGAPLSFASAIGDKIRFYDSSGAIYKIAVAGSDLQLSTSVAGDKISLNPNGVQTLVALNGNVGIGTGAPTIKLAIGDTDTGLHWVSDGIFKAYTNGVEVASVEPTGINVTTGSGTSYTTAPIEIATTATPRISFHWPGVVASQLGMDSGGTIRTYDNPGTGYANFAAASITGNGNIVATGNAYGALFADYNDANYYVDPAATSNLNAVYTGNIYAAGRPNTGYNINAGAYGAYTYYAYDSFCVNESSGNCQGTGGVVLGRANTGATNNIPSTGNVFFNSGNVGIGTASPTYKLHVVPAAGSNAIYGLASNSAVGIVGQGLYGVIGTGASGGYDFLASGAGTDYGTSSSKRWKRNIQPINNALSKILNLNGVYFDWDAEHGGQHGMGMIAEDVGKIVPEIVGWEPDGSGYASGMDYGHLTPVLVEAIKEQQKQIEQLQKEIEELKKLLPR